jgi:CHASE3 domain sensor protein
MPELETVEETKNAGFVKRTRTSNADRIKKDEEELKQLMEEQKKPVEEKVKEAEQEIELSDEEKASKILMKFKISSTSIEGGIKKINKVIIG